MVCRIPANCKAGIYCTPSLEAIHVVPQKKQTTPNAKIALPLVPLCLNVKGLRKEAWRVTATIPFNASLTFGRLKRLFMKTHLQGLMGS